MAIDPRTPVLVGAGQVLQRPADAAASQSPAELMAAAARAAADDAGPGASLLARVGSVRAVDQMTWRYPDTALAAARAMGIEPRQTVMTTVGGNSPQMLVNRTSAEILAGRLDVAVICGAEAIYSRRLARGLGASLDWPIDPDDGPPDVVVGIDRRGTTDDEQARGLLAPTAVYPLFEVALWAESGRTADEHRAHIAGLWSRFSAVAAANPHAWSPRFKSPEEIEAVTDDNRMITFPYSKWLCANIQTDQAAALILCSAEAATAAGVSRDRWVFPWSGADAHDHWYVSDRHDLHSSPAIRACGRAALDLAGCGIDDVAHVDLYSCFPAAVQIGAAELGLRIDDPDRPLTVTGGLTFAGGPGNNYVTHSIAAMAGALRADPGSVGLVTALGWYLTKHSVGAYSTEPPPDGFRHSDVQAEVDALPACTPAPDYDGDVVIESFSIGFDRDGATSGAIVACRTPHAGRVWANVADGDVIDALLAQELPVGTRGTRRADATLDAV